MSAKDKLPGMIDPGDAARASSAREAWRIFGIMAEFVEATERLQAIRPAVSIFGSARTPREHPYYDLTERIARQLSDAGFSVISGGGPGIMEAANKGAFHGKSPSVGLNIQLPMEQSANVYQDISHSFEHFFARKYMFVRFAAAYVVMPGGFGTLDELMEALTLIQTHKSRSIPIILVHTPFWQGLIDWFRSTLVAEGMISASDIDLVQLIDDPAEVVEAIFRHYENRSFLPLPEEHEAMLNLQIQDARSKMQGNNGPPLASAGSTGGSVKLPDHKGFSMRPLLSAALIAASLALAVPSVFAQAGRPADLQPIPEPPPPLPLEGGDVTTEPQVTIIQKADERVEEYRMNGKLYMIKVTPSHGVPYYLMDENGGGVMTRYDDLDQGLRVPKWVIFSFD